MLREKFCLKFKQSIPIHSPFEGRFCLKFLAKEIFISLELTYQDSRILIDFFKVVALQ